MTKPLRTPPERRAPEAEILAVVDAADRVIGRATRAEVHRRGLRHRAAHILVVDRRGAIYMQQRAASKDTAPGLWDTSAAGHVDDGESYIAAARRELAEELALDVDTLEELWALPASAATGQEFVRVYRYVTRREPVPDAHEIAAAGWYTCAQLEAWIAREPHSFTAVFRDIFARYNAQVYRRS